MSEFCEHETFKDVCGICHRDGVITRLRADNERLRAALDKIATAKPQQIGDTGFQQGPLSLWQWAQRIARAALDGQPAPGKEGA